MMNNYSKDLIQNLINSSMKSINSNDNLEFVLNKLNNLEKEYKQLEKEYKKIKDENTHLVTINYILQEDSKVNAKSKSYAGKLDEYHLAKLDAEHQVLVLEGKVSNLQEENIALKKELEKIKEKNELYKTSIETQKNDIEELNNELKQQRNKFKFWKKNG